MTGHLIASFEQQIITTFPFYQKEIQKKLLNTKKQYSSWNNPQCSARLKSKTSQNITNKIKLSSSFENKGAETQKKSLHNSIKTTSKSVRNKMKRSDAICNISSPKSEMSSKERN